MQEKIDGRRLEGKTALVTGASRGIGAAIARRLAAEGATVECMARTLDPDPRYEGTLRDTVDLITAAGGKASAFKADLSSSDDRKNLIDEVHNEIGPIDILVNNAAVTFFLPIDSFPEKRFKLMMETQVWGAIDLAQQVIPDMRSRGAGWILNISSRAAVKPVGPPFEDWFATGNSSVYGMCKAALALASAMDGALMDDYGNRIRADSMQVIKADLEKLYDTLDARELSAGSALGRRLFS